MEAREQGSGKPFRRVGRHKRTKRFYWYGTPYAKLLRKRKLLAGSISVSEVPSFFEWATARKLEIRTTSAETKRQALVRLAKAEIGVTEVPLGSNAGPRVDYYRRATTLFPFLQRGWPWCAAFVVRMALNAGYNLPRAARTASVWHFTEWARKEGRIVTNRPPKAGDVVILIGQGVHMGIWSAQPKSTVEGNTTADGQYGSQYEGTVVAAKNRSVERDVVYVISLDGL